MSAKRGASAARAVRGSSARVSLPATRGPSYRAKGPGTLVVVDNRPLRHTAWAEYHRARKRSEKANADLRRHEDVDVPAFREWFHRTFPVEISTLRQIHEELVLKGEQVRRVDWMSDVTGRSPQSVWREYKKAEQRHADRREEELRTGQSQPRIKPDPYNQDLSKLLDAFFDAESSDDSSFDPAGGDPAGPESSDPWDNDTEPDSTEDRSTDPDPTRPASPHAETELLPAREIYRRLVQHLHPDRGGEWTPARERLWHEVQAAWAARDADWLARLETDWESAHATLQPDSPLSHLRRAIRELEAARRDVERKLRVYRKSQEWRFTTSLPQRAKLHRHLKAGLEHELQSISAYLRHLDERLASWDSRRTPHRRAKKG